MVIKFKNMKKIILFGALVLSITAFGQDIKTFKIGNLEVMTEDLGKMNWDEAMKACADLGDGWRLPTREEADVLYENKEEIGGFGMHQCYWTSAENQYSSSFAYMKCYTNGGLEPNGNKRSRVEAVRAVRGVEYEPTVKIVTIGNLDVMTKDLGKMNWSDALKACADLGDGWRLPTRDELNTLYKNKDTIGGFTYNEYWSSAELDLYYAHTQDFYRGDRETASKSSNACYVRAVRQYVKTVKIGNLEVMTEDLGKMNWDEAMKACADLGDGSWRLPTKDELNTLYKYKEKIGGFGDHLYWSSAELDLYNAWGQGFDASGQANGSKGNAHYVRAVRQYVKTVKIGNLEVMTEDLKKNYGDDWDDAMKACADLEDGGWRLPTRDELNTLYKNKEKIGGFGDHLYWSSEEYDSDMTWYQNFYNGIEKFKSNRSDTPYVRAVRAF